MNEVMIMPFGKIMLPPRATDYQKPSTDQEKLPLEFARGIQENPQIITMQAIAFGCLPEIEGRTV